MKKSYVFTLIIVLFFMGMELSCAKESDDLKAAKKELQMLMDQTINYQRQAATALSNTRDTDQLLLIISNVTIVKASINPGIDRIANRYPYLKQEEIEVIKDLMEQKGWELNDSSMAFERTVDWVIDVNKDDEAATRKFIYALKEYQMVGQ